MKMPTLRVSAGNKSCCPICRRAFSEHSRWLAEGLPDGSLGLPVYRCVLSPSDFLYLFCALKLLLHTRSTRRQCLCVELNQSGSFSRFPKAEPLVVGWGFQGGENRNSPLANLCFLSFRQERKGPPRPQGHACASRQTASVRTSRKKRREKHLTPSRTKYFCQIKKARPGIRGKACVSRIQI